MPKKTPPKEMMNAVTDTTIQALSEIVRLRVMKYAEDVSGAVSAGAFLLAISRVDNDDDGDGFRYLIGLREGTEMTQHLEHLFD